MPADPQIEVTAFVSAQLREALEQLFFFNARQDVVREGIRASVAKYGVPEIMELNGRIWVALPCGTSQCLFACDRNYEPARLAGVIVFARPHPEALSVTHLAVDPEYTARRRNGVDGLGLRLIATVRQIARQTNGVLSLELPYRAGCYLPVIQGEHWRPGKSNAEPGIDASNRLES
jgi:hypothetical protein